jgi:hypothetical protein
MRRIKTSLRIDAHQHFWNNQPVRDAWIGEHRIVLKRNFAELDLFLWECPLVLHSSEPKANRGGR